MTPDFFIIFFYFLHIMRLKLKGNKAYGNLFQAIANKERQYQNF